MYSIKANVQYVTETHSFPGNGVYLRPTNSWDDRRGQILCSNVPLTCIISKVPGAC